MNISRNNILVKFAKEFGGFKEYRSSTVCDLFSALFVGFLKIFFVSVVVCVITALVGYIFIIVTFCIAFSIYCGTWLGDDPTNGVCFFLGGFLLLGTLAFLVDRNSDNFEEYIRLMGAFIKDKARRFCTIITFKD